MKWAPADIIVLILTIILGGSIWFAQVRPLFNEVLLSPEVTKAVAHLDGAMIAIISLYIGSRLNKKQQKPK